MSSLTHPTPAHLSAPPQAHPLTTITEGVNKSNLGVVKHADAHARPAGTPTPPKSEIVDADNTDVGDNKKRKMEPANGKPLKRACHGLRVDTSLHAESLPAPRNKTTGLDVLLQWRKNAAPQSTADEVAYRHFDILISPLEFGKKCFHEKYSLEEFESERDKLLVRWEEFKQTGKGWNPQLEKSFPIFDGPAPADHPYPQAFKGEDFLVKKRAYDRAKAELLVSLDTHARHTLLTYANASAGEQGVLYDEMAWTNIVNAYPSLPEWDFEYREVFEAMQDIGMFPSHLDYEAKPNNHMVNNVYLARMALAVQYTEEDVAHAKRLLNAM